MKVEFLSQEESTKHNDEDQYEKQLLQTLRDLKSQMEPMSYQISELQEKNEFEKEQSLREKMNLQMKTVELEAELERFKDSHKLLEQKLIRESERTRKFQDTEKTIRKL